MSDEADVRFYLAAYGLAWLGEDEQTVGEIVEGVVRNRQKWGHHPPPPLHPTSEIGSCAECDSLRVLERQRLVRAG